MRRHEPSVGVPTRPGSNPPAFCFSSSCRVPRIHKAPFSSVFPSSLHCPTQPTHLSSSLSFSFSSTTIIPISSFSSFLFSSFLFSSFLFLASLFSSFLFSFFHFSSSFFSFSSHSLLILFSFSSHHSFCPFQPSPSLLSAPSLPIFFSPPYHPRDRYVTPTLSPVANGLSLFVSCAGSSICS
ncbi:uncharacterized protein BO66DRAFT_90439 [Aspergillus aculeatinus CBS 121060]|uniref:Uncharacterized protein n=1 Tax=Aspergillus aculeatinus CBS 121060 TaxID=1448322 RepID=A0ACD1H9D6_9EURO|nr:hypothetical protein BO66DRAFT_90439 [Aspergillus aculeatinus CBS 121060]RAH70167.1 hypothetical protein BO66DRAFT_90439 [Aspergillus aculeatinus CBS 121060]